jgi:ribosome-associated toxin RatA of RatAB toxin-antitoxin module
MTTQVQKSIVVNLPVTTVYNQWTQFQDFPQFMNGVKSITQLGDDRLEWVAEIAGVRRQWEAKVLEQVPDQKVAWAATDGATNAGSVTFTDLGTQTEVHLFLEYEPEGLVEKVGDKLNVVENQAEGDLERFKAFIESEGYASGAWRGTIGSEGHVGTPGVEHADASRGDDGKAGVSGKAVAAGIGAAAATVAGVAAAAVASNKSNDGEATPVETTSVAPPVEVAPQPSDSVGTGATTAENPPHVFSPEEVEAGKAGPLTGSVPDNPSGL